jgi:hypothetical protein
MRAIRAGSGVASWVLGAAALAVAVTPAAVMATNTVPYHDSFEAYAPGTGLVNSTNWYGLVNTGLVVRAMTNNYSGRFPLPLSTHSNVVELVEPSTNFLDHAGGDTNIWLDFTVLPVRSASAPEVTNDVQMALYFNTNGHIVVKHSYTTIPGGSFAPPLWTELQHAPLATDQWARVTIKFDYLTGDIFADGTDYDRFFEVHLNGGPALTNQLGLASVPRDILSYPDWTDAYVYGGTWFMIANEKQETIDPLDSKISSVALEGTGFLDDLVVTNGDVLVVNYTTKGVPNDWLDLYGFTDYENDQNLDQDQDGPKTWEEYVAGTNPTDSNSTFRVLSVARVGAANRVTWYGTLDSGVTTPFSMLRNTNLTTGAWSLIATSSIPRSASGTNVWDDTNAPAGKPAYYRPMILW